jgi:hypothetical protein
MDFHRDHTSTCTAHSGVTKAHDWMVGVLGPLFRSRTHFPHAARRTGKRRPTARRRGNSELPASCSWTSASRKSSKTTNSLSFPTPLAATRNESSHNHDTPPKRVFKNNYLVHDSTKYKCTANVCVLFLQAHRETEAHFNATGMPSQHNNSDMFRFKRAAFYQSLKSKVGLAAAKAAALRIKLNVKGCGIVAAPVHAPSRTPLLPPLLFKPSPSPPRSLVRDGQTSPHRPRLVVSRSTCPPLFPSPHANRFITGTAVINTHTHRPKTSASIPKSLARRMQWSSRRRARNSFI